MKHLKERNLKAFIFFLWHRELSEDLLTLKELLLSKLLEKEALQSLDVEHMARSKQRILENTLDSRVNLQRRVKLLRITHYASAAVIAFLFSLGVFFTYSHFYGVDVYTAQNEKKKIILKDGTVVLLLPSAKLSISKTFPGDTRLVHLEGDAIFSVTKSKNHPFVVQAQNFRTKVLGTVFKITQSRHKKSVDLYEGRVAIAYGGTSTTYLKPNQVWTNLGIDYTSVVLSKNINQNSPKGYIKMESLSFYEVPFGKIIEALQSYYNIHILYPEALASKKVSAELKGNIEENLDILAFAVGLQVEKNDDIKYVLKK